MSLLQDVKALDIVRLPRVSVITSPSAQGLILGSAGHGSGMGFGTVLVRCWDQTWSLGRTGLSLSDPGLDWWKYVHLSSPFLGITLPDTFPSPPSPRQAWLLPCLLQGEGSFRYHLIAVGSLPVLPLFLGPDDPYPFKRSLFGGGDYRSLGTSLGRMYSEQDSQSGVSALCQRSLFTRIHSSQ